MAARPRSTTAAQTQVPTHTHHWLAMSGRPDLVNKVSLHNSGVVCRYQAEIQRIYDEAGEWEWAAHNLPRHHRSTTPPHHTKQSHHSTPPLVCHPYGTLCSSNIVVPIDILYNKQSLHHCTAAYQRLKSWLHFFTDAFCFLTQSAGLLHTRRLYRKKAVCYNLHENRKPIDPTTLSLNGITKSQIRQYRTWVFVSWYGEDTLLSIDMALSQTSLNP